MDTRRAEKMKVAIYARVSSDRQDMDLSISAQLKALREYASRNGHIVVREYVDEAESGRSIDRPGFKQMIATSRPSWSGNYPGLPGTARTPSSTSPCSESRVSR